MKPFIKYPGGKVRELKYILPALPDTIRDYYEPFVGGGAVFFELENLVNGDSHINDKSWDLYNLYVQIKENPDELVEALESINNILHTCDNLQNEMNDLVDNYIEIFRNKDIDRIGDIVENGCNLLTTTIDVPRLGITNDHFLFELKYRLTDKIKRMYRIQLEKGLSSSNDIALNIETGIRNTIYMLLREKYNHPDGLDDITQAAVFYYIREFCYSSMFRFNKNGEFNVPYGGMSYNRKYLDAKIDRIKDHSLPEYLKTVEIQNLDFFEVFENLELDENDFIFLDPPYDTEFSTYDNNEFTQNDQIRLAEFLQTCMCKFMLVIKRTKYIEELYKNTTDGLGNPIQVNSFDKKYTVSFMNRNAKQANHLMITNY